LIKEQAHRALGFRVQKFHTGYFGCKAEAGQFLARPAIAAALVLQLIDYSVEEGPSGSSAPPQVPGPVIAL